MFPINIRLNKCVISYWWLSSSIKICSWLVCYTKNDLKTFCCFVCRWNVLYLDENSSNVVFNCNGKGILNIDLNNTNLEDTNYDKDDPNTIIHARLLACHIKFEKRKALKKELNEDLMLIAWHLKR